MGIVNFSDLTIEDVQEGARLNRLYREWHAAYRHAQTFKERCQLVRTIYREMMPHIMDASAQYQRGMVDPYVVNWQFTAIEEIAWHSLRGLGLPFYPQVPVDRYFVDFASPYFRLGIELDGVEYHNEDRDDKHDTTLMRHGWTIFRITGREANATLQLDDQDEESPEFWETSHGILTALDHLYFRPDPEEYRYFDEAMRVLDSHQSGAFLRNWYKHTLGYRR